MAQMSAAGTYDHRPAWLGGVILSGLAVVTVGLCGAIAVLVRNAPDPQTAPVGAGTPAGLQWLGLALLLTAAIGYALSHAASQEPGRLPAWLCAVIARIDAVLRTVPVLRLFRSRLAGTAELSRFVAVVGPFACSVITGAGTWLATDLGPRAFFVGGAFAGAAAAGAAILVEPENTNIQSAGMFVSLLFGAVAAFGWSTDTVIVLLAGSLWIIVVADVTDAITRRVAWATFALVGAVVASTAVLSELDNTLASLTVSGRQPRSFGDLAPMLEPQHAAERVREVASTWLEFRRSVDPGAVVKPPTDLLIRSVYALVHTAGYAVAATLLLIALTNFLLDRLDDSDMHRRLRSILTVTKFTVPVLFVLDLAETLSGAAAVLPLSASQAVTGSGLDGVGRLASLMAVLHWGTSVGKALTILGAAVAFAATGVSLGVTRRLADGARTPAVSALRLVRAHLVLLAVLTLALRNRQVYDAIRRLARGDALDGPAVIALALAALLCACALRYLAEVVGREAVQLGAGTTNATSTTGVSRRDSRTGLGSTIDRFLDENQAAEQRASSRFWHGSLAGALAIIMALFLGAPGALIPVTMWLVLELLSLPLKPRPPEYQQIGQEHRRHVWFRRFAIGGVIGAVTVGGAWAASLAGGTAAVRWFLIAIGFAIAAHALTRLIPVSTLLSSWFGLRPAARAGFGLVPLFGRLVPAIGNAIDTVWGWLLTSIVRRLLYPLVWALQLVRSGTGSKLQGRLSKSSASAAPVSSSDTPAAEAPAATGTAAASAVVAASDVEQRARAITGHTAGIARVLGGLVPVLIGGAIIRSALGLALYDTSNRGGIELTLLGVLFVAAGPVVYSLPTLSAGAWGQRAGIAAVRLAIAAIFVLYLLGWQLVDVGDVITVTRALGAIGVLCVAIALFAVIATTISYLIDATVALPSLQLLRIRQVPFYGFAVAWLVIAGTIDQGGYHNIATRSAAAGTDGVSVSAQQAFDAWAAECATPAADDGGDTGRSAVPMVFVAASGGGIRAAYWTATALEKFDRQVDDTWGDAGPCNQPIFAASGASGGSLGIASYAVNHVASSSGQPTGPDDPGVKDRLNDDYLAPAIGWLLLADVVRPFFLWDLDGDSTVDRARVLELAWESSWEDLPVDPANLTPTAEARCSLGDDVGTVSLSSGLRETWCLGAPLLFLNGAEANSACRFNTSVLDNRTLVREAGRTTDVPPTPTNCLRPPTVLAGRDDNNGPMGATIDLADYLCDGDDISMSTAALLSARFPFVSPSGRVEPCEAGDGTSDIAESDIAPDPSFVVDGGYIDNSGASSLVELWGEVSAYVDSHNADPDNVCIVPVFLQLDNGYDFDTGSRPKRPDELVIPLATALGSRGSREAEAKQVAANIFTTPDFSGNQRALGATGARIVRWARIVPEAHPGVQAPLGWVLSQAATADLDDQLDGDVGFDTVDAWLADGLRCSRPN